MQSGGRWLTEQALCHPVAATIVIGARLLGFPVGRSIAAAVTLDPLVPLAAARHPAPAARFLRLWTVACRFRSRWPRNLERSERALQRQVSVGTATTRVETDASPGQRMGTIPPLARLPHRIEGTTVAWAIDLDLDIDSGVGTDLDPSIDPTRLAREAKGLALVDSRVLSVDVRRRRDVSQTGQATLEWEVVVDFDIEPPSWSLSIPGRGQFFASIELDPTRHHRHEKGGSHGNG